jgi:hypothetical protein
MRVRQSLAQIMTGKPEDPFGLRSESPICRSSPSITMGVATLCNRLIRSLPRCAGCWLRCWISSLGDLHVFGVGGLFRRLRTCWRRRNRPRTSLFFEQHEKMTLVARRRTIDDFEPESDRLLLVEHDSIFRDGNGIFARFFDQAAQFRHLEQVESGLSRGKARDNDSSVRESAEFRAHRSRPRPRARTSRATADRLPAARRLESLQRLLSATLDRASVGRFRRCAKQILRGTRMRRHGCRSTALPRG